MKGANYADDLTLLANRLAKAEFLHFFPGPTK